LRWAAAGFGVYALTQAFVPPLDFFPARLVNVQLFESVAHFPIQALRAVLAVGITLALMRAVQAVEVERQKQYQAAQQARIEALEQVKRDIIEREAMRRELLRHTVLAQEEERGRIARELHDETAQELTAFSLHLAALRDALPRSPEMSERMARLQALTQQMSNGIYRLVHDLRPAQLDDLGLVPALHYLAEEQCRQTGLQVDVQVHGLRQRLDPLVETVLFRVAQEALANATRYAHVQSASLLLVFGPEQVRLWVRDEGVGFDPLERRTPPHGWGLAGMRERAESAGGQMRLQSAPGGGTTVEVLIPLVKEEQQAAPASGTDQN
jgi:signal transduction histidine kinase